MSISIQTKVKEDYLHVRCKGTYTKGALLELVDQVLDRMEQENLRKALVDITELGGTPPTILERYEIGEVLAKKQGNRTIVTKIAAIGKEPIVDPNRFAETVAVNRGAFLKVFTNVTEAMDWLRKEVENKEER